MTPRGLRNHNPLNIRRSAQQWRGASDVQADPLFVTFLSDEWGLRAAFCLLATYRRRYGIASVADIVARWAPPGENDTEAYVRTVCRLTGFGGQQRLVPDDWPRLVRAMARVECGTDIPQETVNKAYELFKRTR